MPAPRTPTEITPALLKRFPLPSYEADADKKTRGKLLVIAGSRRLPGTALLVARDAAAIWSVHLHALTGETVSRERGEDGPLASDLIETLPQVLRGFRGSSL